MSFETLKIEAEEIDYLYIKPSGIPGAGKGLYTAIKIFKSEIISVYTGEILSQKEASKRSANFENAYFINMLNGTVMDSAHIEGFAKYANDPDGSVKSGFSANAIITIDEEDRVCLVAKRNIKAGEEIFCSYGKAYWENFNLN